MREFSLTISDQLKSGLRKDYRDVRNSASIESLRNLKPSEFGLVPFEPITIPFDADVLEAASVEWDFPFPKMVRGANVSLLFTKYRIFEIDSSDWSLHQMTTYDSSNMSNEKGIPGGRSWSFVDFGNTFVAVNGMCVVFYNNKEGLFGGTNKALIDTSVRAEAVCEFKGRLLTGGFDEEFAWSSAWTTFWEGLADNSGISFDLRMSLKPNQVMYSAIGGGDLSWLHIKDDGTNGYVTTAQGASENPYSSSNPLVIDWQRRGDSGILTLPSQGLVRALKPLGNFVLAYCDDGVFTLVPFANEVVSGFGYRKILNVGIECTGAVEGDDKVHVFLDSAGYLRRITSEKIENLGYLEFFSSLLGNDPIVSYDSVKEEFFISTNEKCFVLTKHGLAETTQLVTSIIQENGQTVGIGIDEDYIDRSAEVIISGIDYNVKGMKTITGIEIGGELDSDTSVACDYTYEKSRGFNRTRTYPLNKEGVVTFPCAGIEHKVVIQSEEFSDTQIDYVKVSRKYTDKRFLRGPYASQASV